MAVQTDRIERDVLIAAPVERVWELVTSAEHLGRWFGDAGADIDLRPGGAMSVNWQGYPTVRGRVEAVESPHRFAWRWLTTTDPETEATSGNSTLVEFTLAAEGGGTRVAVVESGFDALDLDAEERSARFASHTGGWTQEIAELGTYALGTTAGR